MIEIFGSVDCPRCKKLKLWLNAEGLRFLYIDLDTTEGMAEGAYRGILSEQLPVVYKDGQRIGAFEPAEIMEALGIEARVKE